MFKALFENSSNRCQGLYSYNKETSSNLNVIFNNLFKEIFIKAYFDEDHKTMVSNITENIYIIYNEFGDKILLCYTFYVKKFEKDHLSFYVCYYTSSNDLYGDEKTYKNNIYCLIYYNDKLKPSFSDRKVMKEFVNSNVFSIPSFVEYSEAVKEIRKYNK